jgi:anti-sigma regulatory factor (Ser/Thr protein kinase)
MRPPPGAVIKHVHGSFEASPDAPGRARLLVADALDRWGISADRVIDRALLLTSELVTNAIRHCRRRVEVDVHLEHGTLRVSVLDESPLAPEGTEPEPLAERGRGLRIVDALSTAWGVVPDGAGKRVWFELEGSAPLRPRRLDRGRLDR